KYDDVTRGNLATPGAKEASHPSSSSFFDGIEEAKKHPRWLEFDRWCRSQPNGSPSPKGFRTWLNTNRPKFTKPPRSKLHDLRPYEPEGWVAEKRDGFAPSILEIMKKVS